MIFLGTFQRRLVSKCKLFHDSDFFYVKLANNCETKSLVRIASGKYSKDAVYRVARNVYVIFLASDIIVTQAG